MAKETVDVHAALREVAHYWDVVQRAALSHSAQQSSIQECDQTTMQYRHHTGQLLHTMERLLRSCRATLVAQLAALRQSRHTTRLSCSDIYSGTSERDTRDKVCYLLLGDNNGNSAHSTRNDSSINETYVATLQLARRTWIWSLCVALIRGSLMELSATLDMAQELFPLREVSRTSDTSVPPNTDRALNQKHYMGLFFTPPSHSAAASGEAYNNGEASTCSHTYYVRDALVVHACVLLYNTVMLNMSAAEAQLRRWQTLLTQLELHSEQDDTSTATGQRTHVELYFCRSIAFMTKCLAAEEYGVAGNYMTSKKTTEGVLDEGLSMSTCCPCVPLLLHVLFVHAVRRRWLSEGSMGNAFRPRFTVDLTKCAAPAVYRDCTHSALERIVTELQALTTTSSVSSGEHNSTDDAVLQACLRLQQDHMPERCYPWPLPSDLVAHILLHYTL